MILDVILLLIIAVAPAIVFHEIAHGLVAYWMGDSTAKDAGRLTINPIKHIDPVGSIIVPGALFLLKSPFFFGWAKPVPVNFSKIKNFRLGLILVAIAGPLTNLVLAYVYILIYKSGVFPELSQTFGWAILFNIVLCVFNLLPIPPLDGSRIVMGILPKNMIYHYGRLEPFGLIIVVILIQFGLLKFLNPVILISAKLLGVSL